MFGEHPRDLAIGFENAERFAVRVKNDVHGTLHPMLREELARFLATGSRRATLVREFACESAPASWTVLPMRADGEWLEPLIGDLSARSVSGADRVLLAG